MNKLFYVSNSIKLSGFIADDLQMVDEKLLLIEIFHLVMGNKLAWYWID